MKVTIHQAKTHLSRLIEAAVAGEVIIIAKRNKPLVKLVPLETSQPDRSKLFGCLKGYFPQKAIECLSDDQGEENLAEEFNRMDSFAPMSLPGNPSP